MRVDLYGAGWPVFYKTYIGHPFFLITLVQLYKVYEHFASSLNVSSTFVPIDFTSTFYQKSNINTLEISLDGFNVVYECNDS